MSVPFRPIISALLRNRTGALLVALQIAITLAVLVNAVYIVKQRIDLMGRPTGMDDANIFVVSSTGFAKNFDYPASLREDLAYLRSVPGVISAVAVNAIPLSGGGSGTNINTKPGDPVNGLNGNYFQVDEHAFQALGIRLIAGREFRADEVKAPVETIHDSWSETVVLSKPLADALFPKGDALGKTIYSVDDRPATIVGIYEHMLGSWLSSEHPDWTFLSASMPVGTGVRYLVRAGPGKRDALMRTVEAHMSTSNPGRALNWVRPLDMFKQRSYMMDRNMGVFLTSVTALLIAITSLGIFGLATFNVSTRTKQIGTRRAVGARRTDIVRYFLVENWLTTTAGVVVGCVVALAVGYWLSLEYRLPRIDLYYLIGGVLLLWTIGILAAWQPARRASKIPPALASRTV